MTIRPDPTTDAGDERDAIGRLAGIAPGSALGRLRAQRPEVARYAEGSYRALLEPDDLAGVRRAERELIALRVAALTRSEPLAGWHRGRLQALGASAATIAAAEGDLDGDALSPRERAILRHVDRVSLRPASSTAAHLAELAQVGLGPREIVIVAQLAAFLSFQLRAIAGLRLLEEGA